MLLLLLLNYLSQESKKIPNFWVVIFQPMQGLPDTYNIVALLYFTSYIYNFWSSNVVCYFYLIPLFFSTPYIMYP